MNNSPLPTRLWWPWLLIVVAIATSGCASQGLRTNASGVTVGKEEGLASYYHDRYHGKKTASGALHDQRSMTAAHRTLPFGTRVRVRHLESGREVVVRITDRGPFVRGRVIDLSRRAAEELNMVQAGIAPVRITPEN